MKKFLSIISLISGIISLIAAAFVYYKIYMVFEVINGIHYDGFGEPYVYNEPSSRFTILIYIFGILGVSLISYHSNQSRKKVLEK